MSVTAAQQAEIDALRADTATTLRVTVPALEEILYKALPVLDHGFVRVIDYMGDDSAVVQAARVSYGKGTKQVSQDAGLIKYLMRHWHSTPFEMCEIKFHIKLPIFIARQWIRHRTANVNEYSARYSILDREFYIPSKEVLAAQSSQNHQGRGDDVMGEEEAAEVLRLLHEDAQRNYDHYEYMLNEDEDGKIKENGRSGLARELARMNLTLNSYTQWYWKIDLHNLMHFLNLRADSHAQYEIRAFADVMLEAMKAWVPLSYDAFVEYRQGGTSVSKTGMDVIKRLIKGEAVDQQSSGLSAREWRELVAVLDIDG